MEKNADDHPAKGPGVDAGRRSSSSGHDLALIEDDFRAIAKRPDADQALIALSGFLLSVDPGSAESIRDHVRRTVPSDLAARLMRTLFDEFVAEGIAIGRTELRSEGGAEGRIEEVARSESRGRDAALVQLIESARRSLRTEALRRRSVLPYVRTIFDEYIDQGIAIGRGEAPSEVDSAAGPREGPRR